MAQATLSVLRTRIGNLIELDSSTIADDLTLYINLAGRRIWNAHPWPERTVDAIVSTVAPYETGTVALTEGATTCVGTGTTFPSAAPTVRKIALSVGSPWYRTTYVSGTSLTLARAYLEDTESAASFVLYQDEYDVTSAAKNIQGVYLILDRTRGKTTPLPQSFLDSAAFTPDQTGAPSSWSPCTETTAGTPRIRVHPGPRRHLRTCRQIPEGVNEPVSGTQTPGASRDRGVADLRRVPVGAAAGAGEEHRLRGHVREVAAGRRGAWRSAASPVIPASPVRPRDLRRGQRDGPLRADRLVPKGGPALYDFGLGLQTSRVAHGAPMPWFSTFQNVRTNRGRRRRQGMKRIAYVATTATCFDFDGTDDSVKIPYDARTWGSLGTRFTVEWLENADTLSGTHYVLGRASGTQGLTISRASTASGTITVAVTDSAGTTTTLSATGVGGTGTLIAGQLVRDGATLTLKVNGTTVDTDTMSATLLLRAPSATKPTIGAHNDADFWNGKICFVRATKTAKPSQRDGWSRHLNPRADTVLFDYAMEADANNYCLDRSTFGNHADVAGTPSTTTALSVNPAAIQALALNTDSQLKRRLWAVVAGRIVPVTV